MDDLQNKVDQYKDIVLVLVSFINDRGYDVRYDKQEKCWRVVLMGISPENDTYHPVKYLNTRGAYSAALEMASSGA